jgi:hypothetical protein
MSAAEFDEWQAYYTLEPFGEYPANYRAGIVSSVIANVNRDGTKHPEPYKASDFIPNWSGEQSTPQKAFHRDPAMTMLLRKAMRPN